LTLQGGVATDDGSDSASDALGGGILDQGGNVTLSNVIVQNNAANGSTGTSSLKTGASAEGGGIYISGGTLTVTRSIIQNNTARGGEGTAEGGGVGGSALGGGIYAFSSTISISNSSIAGNTAQGGGGVNRTSEGGSVGGTASGGGIYAYGSYVSGGTLTVTSSIIQNNTAKGGDSTSGGGGVGGSASGGGISAFSGRVSEGTLTITSSIIQNNTARGGSGGTGTAGADGGGNGGPGGAGGVGQGGGVASNDATINILSSSIINNAAVGGNGGAGGTGGNGTGSTDFNGGSGGTGGDGGNAQGGGLYSLSGVVQMSNSTVASNTAQGGTGGAGGAGGAAAQFSNPVEISPQPGNAGAAGASGAGQGGGVASDGGTINILNSSIAKNEALGGNGGAGGKGGNGSVNDTGGSGGTGGDGGDAQGGGLYNLSGVVQMINSTVATNTVQGGLGGLGGAAGAAGPPSPPPPPGPAIVPLSEFIPQRGSDGADGTGEGGGVAEIDTGSQSVYINTTFTLNTASTSGGGFFVDLAPLLTNTILENNKAPTGPDYFGGVNTNSSFNFVSNTSGAGTFNRANNILNVATPQLGGATPAPNGTTYYPALPTSVLVDAGTVSVLPIIAAVEGVPVSQATDQVGRIRVRNDPTIDLGAAQSELPTTTTLVNNVSVPFTNEDPEVTLVATVTSPRQNVNEGQIQFTIVGLTSQPLVASVVNGQASVTFGVPANTPLGNYTIIANFVDSSGNFTPSNGSGVLTVFPSPTTPILTSVNIVYGMFGVQETLTAVAVNALGVVVNEGFITFSDGGQTVTAPIINSLATVTLNIPFFSENPFAHNISVGYSDSTGNFLPSLSMPQFEQTLREFLMQLIALFLMMQANSGNT
jgi:hypothetical protein